MKICMVVKQTGCRDLLAMALRERGHSVSPFGKLADAQSYIGRCRNGDKPDLLILEASTKGPGWGDSAFATAQVYINARRLAVVLGHGRAEYSDVRTVTTKDKEADQIVDEVFAAADVELTAQLEAAQ